MTAAGAIAGAVTTGGLTTGARLGLLAAVALAGCSALPLKPLAPEASLPPDAARLCEQFFGQLDEAVAAAGVADAESSRVNRFAYLRSNRFLASYRQNLTDEALPAWADAMLRLDREARAVELAQLPAAVAKRLADRQAEHPAEHPAEDSAEDPADPKANPTANGPALAARIADCGTTLRHRDLSNPERRAALRQAAEVPDEYATAYRVLGLYWLTRLPFAWGVHDYQAGVQSSFDTSVGELPMAGHLVRYIPAAQQPNTDALRRTTARVLQAGRGFLPPSADDTASVLAAHAPSFEVDEALPQDRIGTLQLTPAGQPMVATDEATVYGRIAFTRLHGEVLLQAVYTAWFPARPKTGPLDLLGGEFGALVWRVTLDEAGTPLIFDSMHACGCYHMFFPTPRLQARPKPLTLDEWAFVPQWLSAVALGSEIQLRVASRTHYLVRVQAQPAAPRSAERPAQHVALPSAPEVQAAPSAQSTQPPPQRPYSLQPEQSLRLLTATNGSRRSLYGPDGLVPGSERGERYFFWPMGVPDAGAMRQWGRHATAFIGRRHFDDVDLLQRYFELR